MKGLSLHQLLSCIAIPSWEDLQTDESLPSMRPPPMRYQDKVVPRQDPSSLPILFRERNAWCVLSSQLWLALEIKNIRHETVLVDSIGDTYDGSLADQVQPLPCLQLVNKKDGDTTLVASWFDASTPKGLTELLLQLDSLFPNDNLSWLVPPQRRNAIASMIQKYHQATQNLESRQSPRAGWLFCQTEGYRLDALPRQKLEQFL